MADKRVIGQNNRMPWHIPEDLAYFKKTTMGHTVIMGKNTYLSLGKALPGRKNIVLSRSLDLELPDAEVIHDFLDAINMYPDAFIIGGAQIFEMSLPYVKLLYITHIDQDIEGDTFFPEVDYSRFKCLSCTERTSEDGQYPLKFCVYERLS
jgi:dihydrofolate reductase